MSKVIRRILGEKGIHVKEDVIDVNLFQMYSSFLKNF